MEIQALLQAFTTRLPAAEREQLATQLASHINYLVLNDFERLVQLLYTIDVPEQQLKKLLQQQPQEDAGSLIAELIIDRQLQKEASRQAFRMDAMDDAEKW